jgi:excinuclease ABC subunit A
MSDKQMMMARENLRVVGAREHNLKNITVEIPRDKLVVITGLSGSGKSSLAFDTIFAEGQRRYVESLSAYARQFLGQMSKPDVDTIEGLSPAVSIDQTATSHNPRSTVGTASPKTIRPGNRRRYRGITGRQSAADPFSAGP